MTYRSDKLRTMDKTILNNAYATLSPTDQILVDGAAITIRDMVKERVSNAMLGEGYAREIVGAIGRLLEEDRK